MYTQFRVSIQELLFAQHCDLLSIKVSLFGSVRAQFKLSLSALFPVPAIQCLLTVGLGE